MGKRENAARHEGWIVKREWSLRGERASEGSDQRRRVENYEGYR